MFAYYNTYSTHVCLVGSVPASFDMSLSRLSKQMVTYRILMSKINLFFLFFTTAVYPEKLLLLAPAVTCQMYYLGTQVPARGMAG